jgi:ribosomal protein L37E
VVSRKYDKKWKAKCPRCSKSWNQSDFSCTNCGNNEVLVKDTREMGMGHMYFGCRRCNTEGYAPQCPDCGTNLAGVARTGWFG